MQTYKDAESKCEEDPPSTSKSGEYTTFEEEEDAKLKAIEPPHEKPKRSAGFDYSGSEKRIEKEPQIESEEFYFYGTVHNFYGTVHFHGPVIFKQERSGSATGMMSGSKWNTSKECESVDLEVKLCRKEDYMKHLGDQNIYQIRYPGSVLIINNDFDKSPHKTLKKRTGSLVDFDNLSQLWHQFGSAITTHKNLPVSKMKEAVRTFIEAKATTPGFICIVIMSHGKEDDLIIGSDATEAAVEEIITMVTACPSLVGVPKLLLFQMCRGRKGETFTSPSDRDDVDAEAIPTYDTDGWVKQLLYKCLPAGARIDEDVDEVDVPAREYVGDKPDMMVAFATKPDHVSFRHHETGSWFIEELKKEFCLCAHKDDVKEMMKKITEHIRKRKSYTPQHPEYHNCTSTVDAADTFGQKKLYLFPGQPEL